MSYLSREKKKGYLLEKYSSPVTAKT